MKIQFFGDSFGLPRFYIHDGFDYDNFGISESGKTIQLYFEETYPERVRQILNNKFPNEDIIIINNCDQAYTSYNLLGDYKAAYLHQPDYIVLQVGIVDSSPRKPDVNVPYPFMKGKSPWVSKEEFHNNILEFVSRCINQIDNLKALIFVNIVKATPDHYKRHPGSLENTIDYNNIIQMFSHICHKKEQTGSPYFVSTYLVDMYKITENSGWKALCIDGVHINSLGSLLVAEEIAASITSHEHSNVVHLSKPIIEHSAQEETINELNRRIDEIREHVSICHLDIKIKTTELFAFILENALFDLDNTEDVHRFNNLLHDGLNIIQAEEYNDLPYLIECGLKPFLKIG